MNLPANMTEPEASDVAKQRLLSVKGDPFVFAHWERVLFLHFVAAPELVRPHVPLPLELELHEGRACLSLAAVTMRSFRPARFGSAAWLLRPVDRQQFLNFRTYVRCRGEPGVLFLWGWLSQPFGLRLPSGLLRLPYAFAKVEYDHHYEAGLLRGVVVAADDASRRFAYRAQIEPNAEFQPCIPGSLAEFAMERCTGYFGHRNEVRRFRAWHPAWSQAPIQPVIEEDRLVSAKFPWFAEAKPAGANFALGFERVWLGGAHRVDSSNQTLRHGVLGAFYEMP
jgi:uncharacterized protein YqjF (DUF2071 family)